MASVAHQLSTAVGWTWSWRPPPATTAAAIIPHSSPLFSPLPSFRVVNRRKNGALKLCCDYSFFEVKDVSYQPSGTKVNLLDGVSFSLREKSFGLIFGQSGSGKTTLLQLIAGFSKPMSGSIYVQRYGNDGCPNRSPEVLDENKVGIVFQFPESYPQIFECSLCIGQPDWKARADVVKLLKNLKKELTLLVVSHDLKELSPLVDQSWRMEMGGILKAEQLPV